MTEWCGGKVLPGYLTDPPDPQRAIYAVNAKSNEKFKPLTWASFSMIKGDFRLSAYLGYTELDGENRYELFNLVEDPHELVDLYSSGSTAAARMVEELDEKLAEVNRPYL